MIGYPIDIDGMVMRERRELEMRNAAIAERERCAEIVEKRFPQDHKHANDCPVCILLKKIVEEIRESA